MMLPARFRPQSLRVANSRTATWSVRFPIAFRVNLFLLLAASLLVSCGGDGPSKPEPEVRCATPIFDPLPGTFAGPTNVTITCATVGATIRYTTDGTTPVESSPLYTHPVAISATSTLKARAWRDGFDPSDVATGTYTITGGSCSVGVTTPNGGEQWILGAPHTITWGSNQCGPAVKIELLREGASCLTIAESTPNDGEYEWTAARCAGNSFDYEIRVTDLTSGIQDASNDPFEIVENCAVQVGSPNGGETWTVGTSHSITWASDGTCGTEVRIELLLAGTPCDTLAEATENEWEFRLGRGAMRHADERVHRSRDRSGYRRRRLWGRVLLAPGSCLRYLGPRAQRRRIVGRGYRAGDPLAIDRLRTVRPDRDAARRGSVQDDCGQHGE